MENIGALKNRLIRLISESSDRNLIESTFNFIEKYQSSPVVSEPQSIYESERPMTEDEVEAYFKDEKIVLPPEILEILKASEEDIKNGRFYTEEEIEKMDEEWMKDA